MAKRKRLPPARPVPPPSGRNSDDPCVGRLSNLALELILAGGQVLREDFGFDENQVNEWLDKVLIRARNNREQTQ